MVRLCSTVLRGGTCTNSACRNRHDIIRCESCACPVRLGALEEHRRGKQHLRKVAANHPPTPVESEHPPTPPPPTPPEAPPTLPKAPPTPALPPPPTLPPPTSPSGPPISQLVPPTDPPPSTISASLSVPTYDPFFTVSHESGLDFEVEGTEIGGQRSFPPLSLEILIEETEVMSRLSVPITKLIPAPGTPESWCGLYYDSI
jgi:hypothetical protein